MEKYCIEIYEPGSEVDVMITFKSESPFLSISKGDTLSTAFLKTDGPERLIEVVGVMHILWDHEGGEGPKHKMCIFTREPA